MDIKTDRVSDADIPQKESRKIPSLYSQIIPFPSLFPSYLFACVWDVLIEWTAQKNAGEYALTMTSTQLIPMYFLRSNLQTVCFVLLMCRGRTAPKGSVRGREYNGNSPFLGFGRIFWVGI